MHACHENSEARRAILDGREDDRLDVDPTLVKRLGKKAASARVAHDYGYNGRITAQPCVQPTSARSLEKEPAQIS